MSAESSQEREDYEDDDLPCTHCGGEGDCTDGSDPLGDCPEDSHPCHACSGTGNRKDQVIF
jgi:DnaJ-class molecular chaperone